MMTMAPPTTELVYKRTHVQVRTTSNTRRKRANQKHRITAAKSKELDASVWVAPLLFVVEMLAALATVTHATCLANFSFSPEKMLLFIGIFGWFLFAPAIDLRGRWEERERKGVRWSVHVCRQTTTPSTTNICSQSLTEASWVLVNSMNLHSSHSALDWDAVVAAGVRVFQTNSSDWLVLVVFVEDSGSPDES